MNHIIIAVHCPPGATNINVIPIIQNILQLIELHCLSLEKLVTPVCSLHC